MNAPIKVVDQLGTVPSSEADRIARIYADMARVRAQLDAAERDLEVLKMAKMMKERADGQL